MRSNEKDTGVAKSFVLQALLPGSELLFFQLLKQTFTFKLTQVTYKPDSCTNTPTLLSESLAGDGAC